MSNSTEFEKQLQVLRDAYIESLPEKIRQLNIAWENLEKNWRVENLRELYRHAHSLAGSGATFGFSDLSAAAREGELFLQGLLENPALPSRAQAAQVQALVAEIENCAHKTDPELKTPLPTILTPTPVQNPVPRNRGVYLIEGDPALGNLLARQINPFGYIVRAINAVDAVKPASTEAPEAIILDSTIAATQAAGLEILNRIQAAHADPLPLIVLAARGDFPDRLQAARLGARAYFTKPIEINALVEYLDLLTSHAAPEPYRILIIEDDPNLAHQNALILQKAGMITRIVTDPMQMTGELIDFNPGLILMDLYMPSASGLELAAVIRQQEAFISIPIVFLSAVNNPDIQLAAMRLGADDFLAKPIGPDQLVSSVSTRAQRYNTMRYFMTRDSLTGLLNHTATEERLEIEVARARRLKSQLAHVIIDLDHFKMVNDTYGHPVGDRVLKSLARLLEQRFRKADAIGRYGGEEFGLILPDTDGPTAVRILDELRVAFGQIRHQAEDADFSVTFSAGIAAFPPYADAVKLNDRADKALYLAKNRGRNQVALAG
ncbi:MAG: diguanylate cyclase [Chloroflexi bacterium]|nr:diguanylate cyclase [Chloroflexota bacterium]